LLFFVRFNWSLIDRSTSWNASVARAAVRRSKPSAPVPIVNAAIKRIVRKLSQTSRLRLVFLVPVLVLAFSFVIWSTREPSFEGKSFSGWLREISQSRSPVHKDDGVVRAFQSFGREGVDRLVQTVFLLQLPPSKYDRFYNRASEKTKRFLPIPRMARSEAAASLLRALRPSADWLLVRITNHVADPDPTKRLVSAWLLGSAGEHAERAVPPLVILLRDPDARVRYNAMEALSQLSPNADAAIPAIGNALRRDPNLIPNVIEFLNKSGAAAAQLLPALSETFGQTTQARLKMLLAGAICRINPAQTNCLRFLDEQLDSKNPADRTLAFEQIKQLGPGAGRFAPKLIEILRQSRMGSADWNSILGTLRKGEARWEELLAVLHEKLSAETAPKNRFSLACEIFLIEPRDQEAFSIIVSERQKPGLEYLFFTYLEQLSDVDKTIAAVEGFYRNADPLLRTGATNLVRILRNLKSSRRHD